MPLFSLKIRKDLVEYWELFANSLFILLQKKITTEELNEADEMLNRFVIRTELLFKQDEMTYNLHMLLHIKKCVENWGPLWAHSSFGFEAANHNCIRAVKSARGVNIQILRYHMMRSTINFLEQHLFSECPEFGLNPQNKFLNNKVFNKKQVGDSIYYGVASLTAENDELLKKEGLEVNNLTASDKMVKSECLFGSSATENQCSDNSYVQLKNKTFLRVSKFCYNEKNRKQLFFCKALNVSEKFSNSKNIKKVESISDEIILRETEDIDNLCVFVNLGDNKYMSSTISFLNKLKYKKYLQKNKFQSIKRKQKRVYLKYFSPEIFVKKRAKPVHNSENG